MKTKSIVVDILKNALFPLTMQQIMAEGDIPKINASDLSSVLNKLMTKGDIGRIRGRTTATRGKAFVNRYVWVGEVEAEVTPSVPRRVISR